ncbi:hypothetical protein AB0M43_18290 [Longispora sp. NPDC051575]|uniref:hypothetical protein n=1 Tax=Longispora sp. NPDC051575 TaxID=3154943 RepID=UPI0034479F61
MTDLRLRVGTAAAVIAVGALLALPTTESPQRPPGGPETVASVWPRAVTGTLPAVGADGQSYTPMLFLDSGFSVGSLAVEAAAPSFVLRSPGGYRELAPADRTKSVDAVTATPEALFWLRSASGADGRVGYTVWTAARAGGPARQLTADTGSPLIYGTGYDLQVAEGQVRWAAAVGEADTEIRSVPVDGGPVTTRAVPGNVVLSAWPWVVSAPGRPMEVTNLVTGERRPQQGTPGQQLTCSPVWCRSVTTRADGGGEFELRRTDGTEARRIGGSDASPLGFGPAPLDRYEVYSTPGVSNATGSALTVWLYDIALRRAVRVESTAYGVLVRDGVLCWSTGDHESLVWHFLDLRSL